MLSQESKEVVFGSVTGVHVVLASRSAVPLLILFCGVWRPFWVSFLDGVAFSSSLQGVCASAAVSATLVAVLFLFFFWLVLV